MDKEHTLACTLFVIVFLLGSCVYMRTLKEHFTLDNTRFEQAGVMEYHDNGNTLYIPVFKKLDIRRNEK